MRAPWVPPENYTEFRGFGPSGISTHHPRFGNTVLNTSFAAPISMLLSFGSGASIVQA